MPSQKSAPKSSSQQSPKNKAKKSTLPESEFFGTSQVGTKGQFVIPKKARDKYNIQPGDNILIFGGDAGILAFMKADKLNEFLEGLQSQLPQLKK